MFYVASWFAKMPVDSLTRLMSTLFEECYDEMTLFLHIWWPSPTHTHTHVQSYGDTGFMDTYVEHTFNAGADPGQLGAWDSESGGLAR